MEEFIFQLIDRLYLKIHNLNLEQDKLDKESKMWLERSEEFRNQLKKEAAQNQFHQEQIDKITDAINASSYSVLLKTENTIYAAIKIIKRKI